MPDHIHWLPTKLRPEHDQVHYYTRKAAKILETHYPVLDGDVTQNIVKLLDKSFSIPSSVSKYKESYLLTGLVRFLENSKIIAPGIFFYDMGSRTTRRKYMNENAKCVLSTTTSEDTPILIMNNRHYVTLEYFLAWYSSICFYVIARSASSPVKAPENNENSENSENTETSKPIDEENASEFARIFPDFFALPLARISGISDDDFFDDTIKKLPQNRQETAKKLMHDVLELPYPLAPPKNCGDNLLTKTLCGHIPSTFSCVSLSIHAAAATLKMRNEMAVVAMRHREKYLELQIQQIQYKRKIEQLQNEIATLKKQKKEVAK